MTRIAPLSKPKIVKKRTKTFARHQHQQFLRIGTKSKGDTWRKSKGT
jgi:ribosomal protein L32E